MIAVAQLSRVNLAEQVRERLLREIMDREREPGMRLNVDALAREYGVSATPVREALSSLAATGLVRSEAFLGFSVSPAPEPGYLDEVYDLRLRIEPWLAARAVERAGQALLDELSRTLEAMSPATRDGPWSAHRAHADADARFHDAIAAAAANEPARQALARLHVHLHVSRRYLAQPGGAEATADEHRAVMQAIAARDPGRAEAAMIRHLEGSRERLAR